MSSDCFVALDFAAFRQYTSVVCGAESNTQSLDKMKAAIPEIIHDRLTEKQRNYILMYFFDGLNVREIGERYGVNKATVSRTIRRGMRRIYKQLISIDTQMAAAPMTRAYISNRTKRWMYQ